MKMDEFIKDRDAAFLSLDREKILGFLKKYRYDEYESQIPADTEAFWAGVHIARVNITTMPKEAKELSWNWLREHGFTDFPSAD
jgi:hypothetical protein